MQFRFDPNQEFQVKAIEAICDLFEGQTRVQAAMQFKGGQFGALEAVDFRVVTEAGQLR